MKNIVVAAFLVATGLAMPAHASSKIDPAMQTRITEQLTADGYEVRRIDTEDGYFEVYAMKDGKKYELYLDDALKIVKSKVSG